MQPYGTQIGSASVTRADRDIDQSIVLDEANRCQATRPEQSGHFIDGL